MQSAAYGWTTLVRDDWGQPALACEQADATAFKEEFFPQWLVVQHLRRRTPRTEAKEGSSLASTGNISRWQKDESAQNGFILPLA